MSRRDFLKLSGTAALSLSAGPGLREAVAGDEAPLGASRSPLNILLIVTDQERHLTAEQLPAGYRLPGHETMRFERLIRA
jgi:anaerobic selenocysteine-containing dehydrogenase